MRCAWRRSDKTSQNASGRGGKLERFDGAQLQACQQQQAAGIERYTTNIESTTARHTPCFALFAGHQRNWDYDFAVVAPQRQFHHFARTFHFDLAEQIVGRLHPFAIDCQNHVG